MLIYLEIICLILSYSPSTMASVQMKKGVKHVTVTRVDLMTTTVMLSLANADVELMSVVVAVISQNLDILLGI